MVDPFDRFRSRHERKLINPVKPACPFNLKISFAAETRHQEKKIKILAPPTGCAPDKGYGFGPFRTL